MPYPENLDHHFVVDPAKYDFYAMDCYRQLAEDKMAEILADEVIRKSTDFDGTERAPMRTAEARVTLGVIAAREACGEGGRPCPSGVGQRKLNGHGCRDQHGSCHQDRPYCCLTEQACEAHRFLTTRFTNGSHL
jgi:hypothetical protein